MNPTGAVVSTIFAWFLLVLGFSYLLQAPRWIRLSRNAMQEPERFFPLFMSLLVAGLLIIQVHNIWVRDWPVVITILGWSMTLKASWFLVFPQTMQKFSDWSDATMISMTRISGVIMVVLATLLIYFSNANAKANDSTVITSKTADVVAEVLTRMDIDNIEFEVRDMEEAKAFYGGLFAWTYTDYGPEYTEFHGDKTVGGLYLSDTPCTGGPLIIFRTEDLEAMFELVVNTGAKITQEIFEFPGGRRFEFEDPSGNRLAAWSDK